MTRRSPKAFTMMELTTVIAVIGILIALLLPAVQASRERARRADCANSLTQLITAVHNYEHAHKVYPPGAIDTGHSWIVQILPFMEERVTFHHVDFDRPVDHPNNDDARKVALEVLNCPSSVTGERNRDEHGISTYAGVYHDVDAPIGGDNNGVFFLNSRVRYKDVSDGAAQTMFIGEKYFPGYEWGETEDDGWMAGTFATLRNTGKAITPSLSAYDRDNGDLDEERKNMRGFGSYHGPHGANFAFGDGQIRFLSESIDLRVLQQLAHRADGKLLDWNY